MTDLQKFYHALFRPHDGLIELRAVNPVTLSTFIHGISALKPNDERILKVAEFLGLAKGEVFESADP